MCYDVSSPGLSKPTEKRGTQNSPGSLLHSQPKVAMRSQVQGVCKNLGMGATGAEAPVLELPTLWILAVLDNPSPYHKATWSWVSSNLQPKAPSWYPPIWSPQLSVHASWWYSFFCMGIPAVWRHGPYSEFLPLLLHFPGMPFPKILTHPVFPCPPVLSSNATFSEKPSRPTHYGLIPGIYYITLLWVLCVAHHYWGCVCCFSCLSSSTEVSVPLGIFRSVSLLYPQAPNMKWLKNEARGLPCWSSVCPCAGDPVQSLVRELDPTCHN